MADKKKAKALARAIINDAKKIDLNSIKAPQVKKTSVSDKNKSGWGVEGAANAINAAGLTAIKKTPTGATGGKLQSAANKGIRQKTAADLYEETLSAAKLFAQRSETNRELAAAALAADAITNPGKNGLNYWSDEAGRKSVIDNVMMKKAMAELFNSEKYALNPQTTFLPELPYLKQLEEQKQMQLAQSRVQDDFMKASIEQTAETESKWQNVFKAVQEEADAGDEWYNLLYIDWLLGDRAKQFDFESIDKTYGVDVMDDATYENELTRLRNQRDNLDWETLTGTKTNNYQSRTPLLQDQITLLGKTITDKSAAADLEAMARNNPDFDTLSEYTGPVLKMGENDDYMFSSPWFYINNSGAEDFNQAAYKTRVNYATQQVENYQSPYLDLGYELMDQDEKKVLNVLHAMDMANGTNNEAAYLEAKGRDLAQRRALMNENFWSTMASEDGTAWLAWLMARNQGVMNLEDKAMQTVHAFLGENDQNAAYYDEENMKRAVDSAIHGNIGDIDWLNKVMIGDQNIGQHAFNAVTGLADSVIPLGIDALYGGSGWINQALMAGQAYSGGLQESAERELDPVQTLLNGGIDAMWGALVERIGVDPSVLTGKNNFLNNFIAEGAEGIVDNLGTAAKDDALSKLFGTKSKFEEEVSALRLAGDENAEKTAVANRLTDLLQGFIYEGMGGGLMGVPGNIAESIHDRATGKSIEQYGDPEKMLEIAKSMPEGSEARAIADSIEKSAGNGKKISLPQLGKMAKALGQELSSEYANVTNKVVEDAITNRLVEVDSAPQSAREKAPIIRKIAFGEKLTAAEQASVAWDDAADQVTREIVRSMNETSAADSQRTGHKWVADMRTLQAEGTRSVLGKQIGMQNAATTKNVSSTVKAAAENGEKKTRKDASGRAVGKDTSRKIYFDTKDAKGEGEILRFETQDGELKIIVSAAENDGTAGKKREKQLPISFEQFVEAEGKGTAGIIEAIKDINETLHPVSDEEANTMLASYTASGGNAADFVEGYERAYLAGYVGVETQQVLADHALMKLARESGARQAAKDEAARKQRASDYKAVKDPHVGWLGKVNSNSQVRGYGDADALPVAMEAMTETQRNTAEVCLNLGKAVGLNVVLFESDADSIGTIQNGSFEESTHTVYLDINSGAASAQDIEAQRSSGSLGAAMVRTMSHELTHYLEVASPEMYAKYKAAVRAGLKAAGRNADLAVLIREKIDAALREGRKLTYGAAEAEVIADASEYMLQDSKFTNNLDSTLKGKIKAFIQNFAQKIKDAFAQLTGGHRESKALREIVDGVYHYTKNLQELWDASLQEILDRGTENLSVDATEMVEAEETNERVKRYRGQGVKYSNRDGIIDYADANSDDFHKDGRIYDYDFMVRQKPAKVVVIPSVDNLMKNGRFSRSEVVESGKAGIVGPANEKGHKVVENVYTGRALTITNNSIRHGLNGNKQRLLANAQIGMVIGDVVKNGIPVNGLIPTDENAMQTYAMVTPCVTEDGKRMMAVTHVDIQKNEVSSVTFTDIVHSANGRIYKNSEPVSDTIDVEGESPYHPSRYTISISDLLRDVNISFKSLLSEDVLEHLGEERPQNGAYSDKVLYSTRDYADQTETPEFKRWFGNSKVVNEDGTPKVLYHQTEDEFYVFDTRHKGAGTRDNETPFGIFMKTTDRDISVKGNRQMALYARITNPLRVNNRAELVWRLTKLSPEYARLKERANEIDAEYGAKTKEAQADLRDYLVQLRENEKASGSEPKSRKDLYTDPDFMKVFNAEDEIVDEWTETAAANDLAAKEAITKALKNAGYDGIILKEDRGSWGRSTDAYIALDPEQVKSATDNVGTFDPENPDIRYSTRDLPADITVRDYLREMKPTSRMTETEKYLLKKYQEQLKVLEEKEKLVEEQEEIIRTAPMRNPDGSLNDEITKAKNRSKIYRDQANRAARALTAYERDDGFANILATGRQVVNELQLGSAGGIADAADALEKEVAELTAMLTKAEADVTRTASGQKTAVARGLYNPDELKAAAQKLKDEYGSRMSVKTIADRLALTYGELYANNGAEGAKLFSAAAKDLAVDLLQGNKFRYKSDILPMLREKIGSISLSETDVQEIENRGYTLREYKAMLSPYIKVTEGGSDLSSYATNAQYYGEGALATVLNDDTEGNLAMRLYEVISQEKAKEMEIAYEGMTESQLIGMAMADIAGANLPMSANNQTVEYLRKELMKYAGENTSVAIAVEEAIGKAKTTTAKASKVWREAVKHTETARAAVEYYRKLEDQRRVLELAEQKKALTEQLKSDNAKKLKEKVDKQRAEYQERQQRAREYRRTRDEVDKLRRAIGRKVKRLNALRVRETDQKHVPQELQHVADVVMSTFTDSALGRLAFHEAKLLNLGRTYRLLLQSEKDATYSWDDEIEQDIENLQALSESYNALRNREAGAPSYLSLEGVELETEILQGVDNIVSNVLNMIDSTNTAFLYGREETFNQFANKTGEKLRAHEDFKVRKGWRGKVKTMLDETIRTGNVTPIYFFEHLQNQEIRRTDAQTPTMADVCITNNTLIDTSIDCRYLAQVNIEGNIVDCGYIYATKCPNVLIVGNTVESVSDYGILAEGSKRCAINSNNIIANLNAVYASGADGASITGNTLRVRNGESNNYPSSPCIATNGAVGIIISGNTITSLYGLYLYADTVCVNNIVKCKIEGETAIGAGASFSGVCANNVYYGKMNAADGDGKNVSGNMAGTAPAYHTVTYTLVNATKNGGNEVWADDALYTVLIASDGYDLPEKIAVTMGGQELPLITEGVYTDVPSGYSYDKDTGVVRVPCVTGAVVISAAGQAD